MVDRHMLHRFALLMDDLRDSYEGYQFSRFFQARCLQNGVAVAANCSWIYAEQRSTPSSKLQKCKQLHASFTFTLLLALQLGSRTSESRHTM